MTKEEKLNAVYIGVDLHKYTHTAVVIDCFSEVLGEFTIENKPSEFKVLLQNIIQVSGDKKLIFGLEDVGGNGRSLAKYLTQSGYTAKEVNDALAEGYRTGSAQYTKNDSHDALCVAEVLLHKMNKLPNACPNDFFWTLSQMVNHRRHLVKERTKIKNILNNQLKIHYASYNKFFSSIDGKAAFYFWETYPSPECLEYITVDTLAENLRNASRNRVSTKKAKHILETVRLDGTQTNNHQEIRNSLVKMYVGELRYYNQQITKIEKSMTELLKYYHHKLTTIPGVSNVTACELLAEIKDVTRFSSSAKLAKYAGIAPISFGSADKLTVSKNKQGNRKLNGIFFMLAIQSVQVKNDVPRNQSFYTYYQRKLNEGKCKKQAMICVMRQLVNVVYSILKNNTAYYIPSSGENKLVA